MKQLDSDICTHFESLRGQFPRKWRLKESITHNRQNDNNLR